VTQFTDGNWHRLHPATPFLRGGVTLIAIIGIIVVNLRDIVIELFFGEPQATGDPLAWAAENNVFGYLALGILVLLALLILGFYVSWRMHSFRITDEVVEVRSGILFRTNRKGRLDRIQGINIQRPFFARLFGAARLEVNVAGHDANVRLDYLSSSAADELRLEILRLASGSRIATAEASDAAGGPASVSLVEKRVAEFLAPELDPALAPATSVVSMNVGRLLGSILLSGSTLFLLVFTIGPIVAFSQSGEPATLVVILPTIIGAGSFIIHRFTKSLRYTIASTGDGIRVGYGLFSTSNETLPPGRIHAVQVSQPILWRPAGWWEIKLNRASTSAANGAAGQENTTILPVGNLAEVARVLELVLPQLTSDAAVAALAHGLTGTGETGGFTISPPRARVLRWFSRRRNGFAHVDGAVLFRSGAIWRKLVVVPLARAQSTSIEQGPLERRLGLAAVRVHTVNGPVIPRLGAVDAADATEFFSTVALDVVASGNSDTAHRWRANEVAV
jgi:putative membrane protein